jgi:cytochrome bd ubiquinol oxidase subunit I
VDAVTLSRIQFAMTIGVHFIFVPVSIGVAWMLVLVEAMAWKTGEAAWEQAARFFSKIFALTFAMGVATGLTMVFQFGMNWGAYSRFVGDVFGAPLAIEAIFAFFLESTFLGLYLFGRHRVSRRVHWLSIFLVAVGATLSAFWIIVANSWQQTPAGHAIVDGRAVLVDFWAAVFNPSTLPRFGHQMMAALTTGCFVMAGVAAVWRLRKQSVDVADKVLKLSIIAGLVFAIVEIMPFGHIHAQQVARDQPEKFAATEGLYLTQSRAPIVIFGVPDPEPPRMHAPIEVPGLLSWMAFGDVDATVQGIDAFPPDEIPPLVLTFTSFHTMVGLGVLFVMVMGLGAVQLWRGKLGESRGLLRTLVWLIPFPMIACQFGWVTAEVGRQPWVVYKLLRTADASSPTVLAGEVLASIIIFGLVYLLLCILYVYLFVREINHGPAPIEQEAV